MIKRIIFPLVITFFGGTTYAQNNLNAQSFDFWVGQWNLTWKKADSTMGHGINIISKIVDQKVIEENFEDIDTGFKGTSITVYNPTTKTWHQAWADNQGGYYDFIGEVKDGLKIFKTKMNERNGKKTIQRMVFKNITDNAFIWDWEGSSDGGQTWRLLWRINYKRKDK